MKPTCKVLRNMETFRAKTGLPYPETYFGENLSEHVTVRAGDLQYIPAGCPHLSVNTSKTEPCIGVVARTDPNEQASVVMLPELDRLVPRTRRCRR